MNIRTVLVLSLKVIKKLIEMFFMIPHNAHL